MKTFIISLLPFFLFACLSTENDEITDAADVTNIKDDTSEESIDYCAIVNDPDRIRPNQVPPPAVNSACNCRGFLLWSIENEYISAETVLPRPGQDCSDYQCTCNGVDNIDRHWRCTWFYMNLTGDPTIERYIDCPAPDEED